MATSTAVRAASTFPVSNFPGAGVVQAAYGTYTLAANPTAADIVQLCRLPAGATPIGGYFSAVDIDTGTEVLDIDIGIAANGVDSADPDFFANGGVFSGDAITDLPLTNAANYRVFTGPFPVTTLGAETIVQAVFNVAANAGGTGAIFVVVYYLT